MASSFKIKLKVLSPIHIGSGETLARLDYYFDDSGRFCRVNLDSLFADPDFADQRDEFLQAAPGGQPIAKLVPLELLQKHTAYRLPMSPAAREHASSRALEVKACIKTAGRVYIPGSSLKGAILSALCWRELRRGWDTKRPEVQKTITDLLLRGQTQDREDLLTIVLTQLGGRGSGKFTHWLDVSDSDTRPPAECLALSLVDVKNPSPSRASPAKDLRLLCETIRDNTEFSFTLKLDPDSKLKPEELIGVVNDFYQKVAAADKLATDKQNLPSTGLIRLGGGSGAYATSLLLVANTVGLRGYKVKPPKSRKRAGRGDAPLGWAQLDMAG